MAGADNRRLGVEEETKKINYMLCLQMAGMSQGKATVRQQIDIARTVKY